VITWPLAIQGLRSQGNFITIYYMNDLTLNFSRSEFECSCCQTGEVSGSVVEKIQKVRTAYGKPMGITSGYRCSRHNKEVGGKSTSSHLKSLAIDVHCESSRERKILLPLLLKEFRRVGIANNFIHCDDDMDKDKDVCWTY
jgi:zinc D-Ala-D-Ala carboxypeptidase